MDKTIFEQMGGTYHEENEYLIPNLSLPPEEEKPIWIWGQRHKRYLKEHRKVTYTTLLTSGKLNTYLAGIDQQAEEMFSRLVKQMADRESVAEQLKVYNQLEWILRRMNNICNRATEIVNNDWIYI